MSERASGEECRSCGRIFGKTTRHGCLRVGPDTLVYVTLTGEHPPVVVLTCRGCGERTYRRTGDVEIKPRGENDAAQTAAETETDPRRGAHA